LAELIPSFHPIRKERAFLTSANSTKPPPLHPDERIRGLITPLLLTLPPFLLPPCPMSARSKSWFDFSRTGLNVKNKKKEDGALSSLLLLV
jgi:hypothetical protein